MRAPASCRYKCAQKCPNVQDYLYTPTIYDPVKKAWAKPGSLALHNRARIYHSTSLLLPDCRVRRCRLGAHLLAPVCV